MYAKVFETRQPRKFTSALFTGSSRPQKFFFSSFGVLYDEKMYPVKKQTESRSEIAFYFFEARVTIASFQMYYVRIFSFSAGLTSTHYGYNVMNQL